MLMYQQIKYFFNKLKPENPMTFLQDIEKLVDLFELILAEVETYLDTDLKFLTNQNATTNNVITQQENHKKINSINKFMDYLSNLKTGALSHQQLVEFIFLCKDHIKGQSRLWNIAGSLGLMLMAASFSLLYLSTPYGFTIHNVTNQVKGFCALLTGSGILAALSFRQGFFSEKESINRKLNELTFLNNLLKFKADKQRQHNFEQCRILIQHKKLALVTNFNTIVNENMWSLEQLNNDKIAQILPVAGQLFKQLKILQKKINGKDQVEIDLELFAKTLSSYSQFAQLENDSYQRHSDNFHIAAMLITNSIQANDSGLITNRGDKPKVSFPQLQPYNEADKTYNKPSKTSSELLQSKIQQCFINNLQVCDELLKYSQLYMRVQKIDFYLNTLRNLETFKIKRSESEPVLQRSFEF